MSTRSYPSADQIVKVTRIAQDAQLEGVNRREAFKHAIQRMAAFIDGQQGLGILFANFLPSAIPHVIEWYATPWVNSADWMRLNEWLDSNNLREQPDPHISFAVNGDYSNSTQSISACGRLLFGKRWDILDEAALCRGVGGLSDTVGGCFKLPGNRAFGFTIHRMKNQRVFGPVEHRLVEIFTAKMSEECSRAMLRAVMSLRRGLSPREAEIIKLTLKGYSDPEIADELSLSHAYVREVRDSALGKLKILGGRNGLFGYLYGDWLIRGSEHVDELQQELR